MATGKSYLIHGESWSVACVGEASGSFTDHRPGRGTYPRALFRSVSACYRYVMSRRFAFLALHALVISCVSRSAGL